MTKIRFKYIKEYVRNGEVYRYFRRKGCPPIALPGEPGSREFNAAYEAALSEKPIPASTHKEATFGKLVVEYYGSVEFQNLKPNSRKTYRLILDPLSRQNSHRYVRDMGRENIRKIVETIGATRPGMANLTRAVLKRLLNYAVDRGWRNDNPAAGVARYKLGSRHTWTDDQLRAYEKRWAIGTQQRLDYASLLYSGQRGGDVVQMARPDRQARTIALKQQKTATPLVIPIHPEWRRIIDATPPKVLSIGKAQPLITDVRGRPIKRPMLTLRIARAVAKAGLPKECTAHGLRKALLRRLAEAGRSSKQIAAMSGHKSLKEVERYTEAANQALLAEQAMDGLEPNS